MLNIEGLGFTLSLTWEEDLPYWHYGINWARGVNWFGGENWFDKASMEVDVNFVSTEIILSLCLQRIAWE